MIQVLMVCLGNICRSPMAQAVAEHHAARTTLVQGDGNHAPWVLFASAGTHPGFLGSRCDPRAQAALQRRGYGPSPTRCRKIADEDFAHHDFILAMDKNNLTDLLQRCPEMHRHKVRLFLEFASGIQEIEIPDPYYGNGQGFDRVLDLCEAGALGLIDTLKKTGEPQAR